MDEAFRVIKEIEISAAALITLQHVYARVEGQLDKVQMGVMNVHLCTCSGSHLVCSLVNGHPEWRIINLDNVSFQRGTL